MYDVWLTTLGGVVFGILESFSCLLIMNIEAILKAAEFLERKERGKIGSVCRSASFALCLLVVSIFRVDSISSLDSEGLADMGHFYVD